MSTAQESTTHSLFASAMRASTNTGVPAREYGDNMREEEYDDPEDLVDEDQAGGTEDPDQHAQGNVVASGDPNAAAKAATGVKGLKEKRIANDKRTTTPYMTKYERARVLGTRALQIRSVYMALTIFSVELTELPA